MSWVPTAWKWGKFLAIFSLYSHARTAWQYLQDTPFLQFKQIFPLSKTKYTGLPKKGEKTYNLSQNSFGSSPANPPSKKKPKKTHTKLTRNSRQQKKPKVVQWNFFLFFFASCLPRTRLLFVWQALQVEARGRSPKWLQTARSSEKRRHFRELVGQLCHSTMPGF